MSEHTPFLDESGQFAASAGDGPGVRAVGGVIVRGSVEQVRAVLAEDVSRVFAGTAWPWHCRRMATRARLDRTLRAKDPIVEDGLSWRVDVAMLGALSSERWIAASVAGREAGPPPAWDAEPERASNLPGAFEKDSLRAWRAW